MYERMNERIGLWMKGGVKRKGMDERVAKGYVLIRMKGGKNK